MVFKGYQNDHAIQTRIQRIICFDTTNILFIFDYHIICEMHDISKNMLLCETSDIPLY